MKKLFMLAAIVFTLGSLILCSSLYWWLERKGAGPVAAPAVKTVILPDNAAPLPSGDIAAAQREDRKTLEIYGNPLDELAEDTTCLPGRDAGCGLYDRETGAWVR
jgi:hypothetical protein